MVVNKLIFLILCVIFTNFNAFGSNNAVDINNVELNAPEISRNNEQIMISEFRNKLHAEHKRDKRDDQPDKGNVFVKIENFIS